MSRINQLLLRDSATLEAQKQLLQNMDQIKKSFLKKYDPYVQAVLIQSVINLSATDFERISKDYFDLIEMAKNSPDEWVQRKAMEFSEYPKVKIDDDIPKNFDTSSLENLLLGNLNNNDNQLDSEENNDSSQLELLDPDIKPPSSSHKKPIPASRAAQRVQPRVAAESDLSIPTAPSRPRPIQPQYRQENDQTNKFYTYEKKKEKKVKDISELMDIMPGKKKRK